MKRQIEVFTAGCPVCDPVVKLVKVQPALTKVYLKSLMMKLK